MTKLSRRLVAVAVAAAFMLTLASCGGDDNNDSSGTTGTQGATGATAATGATGATGAQGGSPSSRAATTLDISADPGGALKFDKSELSAKPGKVTITMDNPSTVPHAVGIEGNGVDVDGKTVGKGGVSTVSTNLKAGEYEFYCPVDGHADAGMKGSLTVK